MEILLFLIGFLVGGACVWGFYTFIKKNTQNDLYEKMQLQFENLANKILKENSKEFNELSDSKLNEHLKPFREQIEKFEKGIKEEREKLGKLDENIKNVIIAGNQISKDTTTLATALKGDNKTSGKWGEMILERVLESSGLRRGEEFETQTSFGSKRPDAVIKLPERRAIFIDAKTSFAPYEAYLQAPEDEKPLHLKAFKDSVKAHIHGLAQKKYEEIKEYSSPDFTLMFIPIESSYGLLFADDNALFELAWANKIMPVSPSTLLSALKIINVFHRSERQNKNAKEIADIAGKIYDKFAGLLDDLKKVRTGVDSAMVKMVGIGGISSQLEKIKEKGAATSKEMPKIKEEVLQEIIS